MKASMKHFSKIAIASVSLLALIAAPVLPAFQAVDPTAPITARIVQARDYTASYVVIAKQSLATKPAELLQAQRLYASAYSDYNAWVAYVKTALQDGKNKHLNTDSDYTKIASEAADAGRKFTDYVDANTTGETKAINVILTSLGALGLQLWNGIKDRQKADRSTAANNFEQETKWSPWESITTDAVKPAPAQTPQPGTATTPTNTADPTSTKKSTKPPKPQIP